MIHRSTPVTSIWKNFSNTDLQLIRAAAIDETKVKWVWRCVACTAPPNIVDHQAKSLSDARKLADAHDAEKHNGRPTSGFGYRQIEQ